MSLRFGFFTRITIDKDRVTVDLANQENQIERADNGQLLFTAMGRAQAKVLSSCWISHLSQSPSSSRHDHRYEWLARIAGSRMNRANPKHGDFIQGTD